MFNEGCSSKQLGHGEILIEVESCWTSGSKFRRRFTTERNSVSRASSAKEQ
ncbi:hypothetical protein RchiOBHm_Chr7g0231841 [Rosa chinensis]|uniref:Uncharacterized protein n=1 Tax=Rosa chinensis TaxID=74649 RepID=A0A2P6PFS9_ROSCH|nr:hypothetical protein RchiOBHm_Chr7g0231841 [Rosa chinensis]